ncbi:hypothetical protein ACFQV2_33095 [Actinokineospora soli]|uniref:Uncharacterized protein n=1 Tax=Actinokineospora soli TaxID=1048753 RepID=A0ABW2TXA1_9PSEU
MTTGLKRTATGAHAEVATASRSRGGGLLTAELTPVAPVVDEPDLETTVRGGPASVVFHRPGGSPEPGVVLIVPVDHRWLVLRQDTPDPSAAMVPELVKVAEGVRIGPKLDNPWADGR